MNPLKKIAIQFNAKVTSFINDIENHEAVADSMIQEMKRSYAAAQVSLNQVATRNRQLAKEMTEVQEQIERWKSRALALRDSDQERALECTRRMDSAEKQKSQLDQQVVEYSALETQMRHDLSTMKSRLTEVQLKKHELVGRQRLASMKTKVHGVAIDGWNEQIERWEAKVIENEVGTETSTADPLADDFEKVEYQEELKKKLAELK